MFVAQEFSKFQKRGGRNPPKKYMYKKKRCEIHKAAGFVLNEYVTKFAVVTFILRYLLFYNPSSGAIQPVDTLSCITPYLNSYFLYFLIRNVTCCPSLAQAILAEEEVNPSRPIDYGVELADDSIYDAFMQSDQAIPLQPYDAIQQGAPVKCICVAHCLRV